MVIPPFILRTWLIASARYLMIKFVRKIKKGSNVITTFNTTKTKKNKKNKKDVLDCLHVRRINKSTATRTAEWFPNWRYPFKSTNEPTSYICTNLKQQQQKWHWRKNRHENVLEVSINLHTNDQEFHANDLLIPRFVHIYPPQNRIDIQKSIAARKCGKVAPTTPGTR